MIEQDLFFKRHAVRLPAHLMAPIMSRTDVFEFPRNSVWHFVAYDTIQNGPSSDEYFLRNIDKKILIEHVRALTADKGSPRHVTEPLNPYIREWHLQNRRFRLAEDLVLANPDSNTLAVVNYALLARSVRYVRSVYSEYYKWFNIQSTVWNKISEMTLKSQRSHFVFSNLPKNLVSVQRMNDSCKAMDQTALRFFDSHESFFMLEIWKWLSVDYRKESVIGEMTQSQLDKVNLIFMESGRWIDLNLGELNRWRFIKGVTESKGDVKIPPDQLQKRLLRTFITLMENRTVAENSDLTAIQEITDNQDMDAVTENKETQKEHSDKLLATLDSDLAQLKVFEDQKEQAIAEQAPLEIKDRIKTLKSTVSAEASQFDAPASPADLIKTRCDKLAEDGLLSPAEYRRYAKQLENQQNLTSPQEGVPLLEYIKIPPEDLALTEPFKIKDMHSVLDKSMLETSLSKFDKNYISKVLPKDVMGMVVASQKAGFIITNYEVQTQEDILGKYEMHTARISPIEGLPSTIRFKIPKVEDTGIFRAGNIDYFDRKQRGDLPIRQISPSRIALSSYYGKTFVTRSEKKSNDYGVWLRDRIREIALSDDPKKTVDNIHPADVFDSSFACPRVYSILAHSFRAFSARGCEFFFNHKERPEHFTEEQMKKYEKNGMMLVGKENNGSVIVLDIYGTLYFESDKGLEPRSTFESFLDISIADSPIDFAQAKVFGKNIPVAFVLSYKYGFSKLLKMLKVEPRKVNAGQRKNLHENEYAIEFQDETLIFNRDDLLATIILAGFNEYARSIRQYSVYTLDKKGVYLNILEFHGLGSRYLREIDLIDDMFVDPITEEILKNMNEPITYRGLLVRASELLLTDQHPHPLDMKEMRIKGYERFAGAVYSEIVNMTREHRNKPGRANAQMSMNPYAVWKTVTQDPAVSIVEDINPIMNLKEGESTTYGGTGGRNARAMVQSAREYHPSDMGVISESTTDSGDVAINTYMSANPMFNSVRGTTTPMDMKTMKTSSLMSTTSLLFPASSNDDMKRANFASIQNNHGVACAGYHPMSVRTGYEQVIAHRVGKGFATAAKQDGHVASRTEDGMVIQYKDGTQEGIVIGRRYGSAGGLTLAHEMISEYEPGMKFKEGDVIAYNSGFFERDKFNKTNVLFKMGLLCTVALLESKQTHEDACSISLGLANKLMTKTTKIKDVQVNFAQKVSSVVAQGTIVDHDTILCIIEDSSTAGSNLFDEESLNTLRMLSSQTPTAKVNGVVERVEVYYNGDKDEMHDSLKSLANASDRALAARKKAVGESTMTGEVDESFRIEGEPLILDTVCIRFYITTDVGAGIGDKVVFANQLKSVISEIMEYEVKTKSGTTVDAIFGAQSIFNRIVQNPFIVGTTNIVSSLISKNAAKIYKGEKTS